LQRNELPPVRAGFSWQPLRTAAVQIARADNVSGRILVKLEGDVDIELLGSAQLI
jgi:hypothetical protein